MIINIDDSKSQNANGQKFLDFLNKTFDTDFDSDNGLIGEKVNEYIEKRLEAFTIKLCSNLLTFCELGIIGFSMYQSIKIMFLGNKRTKGATPIDKMLLGYFLFFVLRVFNTLLKIKGDKIEK